MADLDCQMQTKALNLFWHKAGLRLVKQPETEAPVFALSRPTLFGGREEFILQYPAQLEPRSKRNLARHRFTVRHGKKRRTFQATDAATFETWLSALEQALDPKRESDQFNPPSSTATTATATSSQGSLSIASSLGTRTNSRGRVRTFGSAASHVSSHCSVAMPPPSKITLERECFTRDPNNHKLIWLHRPAATTAGAPVEPLTPYHDEAEESYINIFATDKSPSNTPDEGTDVNSDSNNVSIDEVDLVTPSGITSGEASNSFAFVDGDERNSVRTHTSESIETALISSITGSTDECFATCGGAHIDPERVGAVGESIVEALLVTESDGERDQSSAKVDIEPDVQAVVDELVARVVEVENVEASLIKVTTVASKADDIHPEVTAVEEALVAAVVNVDHDSEIHLAGKALDLENTTISKNYLVVSTIQASPIPGSFQENFAAAISARSATQVVNHKWVSLDPTNSSLIWVRCSVDADANSTPRSNPRRRAIKPARKWVPVDPSSTRLIWIRRVENAAARMQSRYKATSNSRKWVPLDPESSNFIWVRRQFVPVGGVATPLVDSSRFRV